MKERIRTGNFRDKKRIFIFEKVKEILEELKEQEVNVVTVRQIFYQLVSRNLIKNNPSGYNYIQRLLVSARYRGELDWDNITDESSYVGIPTYFNDINHLIRSASNSYKLNRWKEQENYVEVWCEKMALSSVVNPIIKKWQLISFIPGGRVSASDIYKAVERLRAINKKCVILYIGDHDPSGLNIVLTDLPKRFKEFNIDVKIKHIALTMEQIKKYNLPTDQISKQKDTNRKWFIEHTGSDKCWELDALKPNILKNVIEKNILKYLDKNKYNKMLEQEQIDINKFKIIYEDEK